MILIAGCTSLSFWEKYLTLKYEYLVNTWSYGKEEDTELKIYQKSTRQSNCQVT